MFETLSLLKFFNRCNRIKVKDIQNKSVASNNINNITKSKHNNDIFKFNRYYNNKSNNTYCCYHNVVLNTSGFSLLELSLVLIIMGILIIGVIRGYALMTASRIITLTNELTQYSFAAEQFSAKYGNLPGIIDNPQKIFGSAAKSKIDDDKIDKNAINETASITNAESINFFNHLYLSGLLGESSVQFVGTDKDLNSKSEITKDSNYYPRLKSLKSMFIYVRGDDINGTYNKLNRLTVSNYSGGVLGINADLIFGLDNKVDDGLPLSGLISIIPMKVSNYDSGDKSSNYNDNGKSSDIQIASVNNIINYYLLSLNITNTFSIINIANAENSSIGDVSTNSSSENISVLGLESGVSATLSASSSSVISSSTSCLVLDKSTNEIKYNTRGKNCFILRNIDSTQQNKITDLAIKDTVGESCNLSSVDDYFNAESVAGLTMLNGSHKTIKCDDGYEGNITLTCNNGQVIHTGDTKCTFSGCKKYDNNAINSSLNVILTTNDIINWDNIDEKEKDILSANDGKSYDKNDVIATLSCKEKVAYDLEDGSNGYTIKCNGNDNIVVNNNGGCEYKIRTCSVADLTTEMLGNNYVKTLAWCDNLDCSILKSDSVIDMGLSENKEKIYDYGTILTINTCSTGYSAPENKRMIRCNENGEWEIYRGTTNNMCTFTGCNDMSAVFDRNNNKISNQLYKMTFAYNSGKGSIYPVLACNNAGSVDNGTNLSTSKKFIVDISTKVTCGGDIYNAIHGDLQHREFICTEDTTNINNGNSYWKYDFTSCDLNEIKGKSYTVWLAKDSIQDLSTISTGNATTLDSHTFQKRYVANKWGTGSGIATSEYNNFALKCNSNGNWVMEKTSNSCSGAPTLMAESKFYSSDTDIRYVDNQTGMLMNKNTLTQDTSTLTKTMLSTTGTYFVTNGTKIEASCNSGYQEIDEDNLMVDNNLFGFATGGHYYECVNGTWMARGGCQAKTCSVANLTTEILGNEYVKTVALCDNINCSSLKADSVIDIKLSENKEKTYDYGTILTIDSCTTGYSAPENKRIVRCNENGEWEIYGKTGNNMCSFSGCSEMSAVFDVNNNKVSTQLYEMTFGSDGVVNKIYPILYCNNITEDDGNAKKLNGSGNFVASYESKAVCADNENLTKEDVNNKNRQYVCTKDINNINGGNSYWKYYMTSCSLGQIMNKVYTSYLSSGVSGNIVPIENSSQLRYLRSTNWSKIYTDQTNDFTLTCGEGGNWVMEKTNNSCSGAPTLMTASKFYSSDTNIQYVNGHTGMLMNKNTLTRDTSTLTKTMLSTIETYFVTNGTKIEASCNSGYQEVDKNNLANGSSGYDIGGHYYECVDGVWTARGGCAIKIDYYSPRYYDDVGKTGTIAASKYSTIGESINCNYEAFGISDPDNGTLKICAVNGYRVAADGETFTIKDYSNYTYHAFCHKSYIPRDLGAKWSSGTGDGDSVGVDGWCSNGINKNTYRGSGASMSNGSSFKVEHSDTGVSANGTLTCDSGTWKNGGGSMEFGYTGLPKSFCVPSGLKTTGKSITFEIWGARGGGNYGGKGGYTKGIMGSANYENNGTYYVVLGKSGSAVLSTNSCDGSYNGGGSSKGGSNHTTLYVGCGGGATHVATSSDELKKISKSSVLLVAGGGGGGFEDTGSYYSDVNGGAGGGNNNSGNNGSAGRDKDYGRGGTSSAGGAGYKSTTAITSLDGSFGSGGNCNTINSACTGGGGGYYGGGASSGGDAAGGAGGGSGYCDTSKFTCSGSNGENAENGKAEISW